MGSFLAKCLSSSQRTTITNAIPDREILIKWADRVAEFEDELRVKKEQKAVKKFAKKMKHLRTIGM